MQEIKGHKEIKLAKLVLEDGRVFHGEAFGDIRNISGEVVFSTGMVGYPESLTDPSYKGQILCLTFPLIGNYGVPAKVKEENVQLNFESSRIQCSGLIIGEYSTKFQHFSAEQSLESWMIKHKIPGIKNIDTRAITKHIRTNGTMLGKIICDEDFPIENFYDPNTEDLIKKVTTDKVITYGSGKYRVILIDCGLKNNILRLLLKAGFTVIRVPYDYDFFNLEYDAIFISNGPGNPEYAQDTIQLLTKALTLPQPIFGICLGHQLLALAAGGKTYKLKYGHRSQNQPCISNQENCVISSQNHGFAVDMNSLDDNWEEFYKNLNDGTNEGLIHKEKPFFSVQFHPEGSSGPQDTASLFNKFYEVVKNYVES